jgi:hypothetical protein
MKTFTNKGTDIKDEPNAKGLTYSDLAVACLNAPLNTGMDILEVRRRINTLDKVSNLGLMETVDLHEEEASALQEAVATMKWGIVHRCIVDFSDDMNSLPQVAQPAE